MNKPNPYVFVQGMIARYEKRGKVLARNHCITNNIFSTSCIFCPCLVDPKQSEVVGAGGENRQPERPLHRQHLQERVPLAL